MSSASPSASLIPSSFETSKNTIISMLFENIAGRKMLSDSCLKVWFVGITHMGLVFYIVICRKFQKNDTSEINTHIRVGHLQQVQSRSLLWLPVSKYIRLTWILETFWNYLVINSFICLVFWIWMWYARKDVMLSSCNVSLTAQPMTLAATAVVSGTNQIVSKVSRLFFGKNYMR